jgi:hypothetical protein
MNLVHMLGRTLARSCPEGDRQPPLQHNVYDRFSHINK